MKLKKNPHKDLNLKRGLYFILSLLFILILLYIILEWKTEDDTKGYDISSFPNKELIDEDTIVIIETRTNFY